MVHQARDQRDAAAGQEIRPRRHLALQRPPPQDRHGGRPALGHQSRRLRRGRTGVSRAHAAPGRSTRSGGRGRQRLVDRHRRVGVHARRPLYLPDAPRDAVVHAKPSRGAAQFPGPVVPGDAEHVRHGVHHAPVGGWRHRRKRRPTRRSPSAVRFRQRARSTRGHRRRHSRRRRPTSAASSCCHPTRTVPTGGPGA